MGKRLPYTPNSKIRAALRMLFLRSRERAEAIRRDKYTCQRCGVKQSKAKGKEIKVEVHHLEGVCNWQIIFDVIRKYLLCNPKEMQTLCELCHEKEREGDKKDVLQCEQLVQNAPSVRSVKKSVRI